MNEPLSEPANGQPTPKGKSIALGAGAGMIFGSALGSVGAGLVLGAALGMLIASSLESDHAEAVR